ncbi:MAG: PaaI family thioesterase [Thermoplasmataceae archaeon]
MEQILQQLIESDRFLSSFPIRVLKAANGFLQLSLDVTENLMRPGQVMNGGAIMSVMDAAGGLCAFTSGDITNEVTVSMTCNFLRPVQSGTVTVTARTIRRGGTLNFCTIEMVSGSGELLAEASGVWRITRTRQ